MRLMSAPLLDFCSKNSKIVVVDQDRARCKKAGACCQFALIFFWQMRLSELLNSWTVGIATGAGRLLVGATPTPGSTTAAATATADKHSLT